MRLISPPLPVMDCVPEAMKPTDLVAWDTVAVYDFVTMSTNLAKWVENAAVPAPARQHEEATRPEIGHRIRKTAAEHVPEPGRLSLALTAYVLSMSSPERLWDLRMLGRWYDWVSTGPSWVSVERIVERHRDGYTMADMAMLGARGVPEVDFIDRWVDRFTVDDFRLVLNAGLTGPELVDVVESGVFPERSMLQVMAGLAA